MILIRKKTGCRKVRQPVTLYLDSIGIYTRLISLTTYGVVRGATRRMYLPSFVSYQVVLFSYSMHKCRHKFGDSKQNAVFFKKIAFFSLGLRVHAHQELFVVFRFLQTVFHEIHRLYRVHVRQVLTQNPHAVKRSLVEQQVIAARA